MVTLYLSQSLINSSRPEVLTKYRDISLFAVITVTIITITMIRENRITEILLFALMEILSRVCMNICTVNMCRKTARIVCSFFSILKAVQFVTFE